MFHRIADEPFDPWGLAVGPGCFKRQLLWLRKHRRVLPLAEFAALQRQRALPTDSAAITFDDGYACTATVAAPLLQKLGLPATIFIAPAAIMDGGRFWWDELTEIVITHPGPILKIGGQSIALGDRQRGDRHWPDDNRRQTSRQRAFLEVWAHLRLLPPNERETSLRELRAATSVPQSHATRLMNSKDVRILKSDLITFGCHALTHPSLPALPASQQEWEIREGARACEALSGEHPTTFAYPFGDYDPETRELVHEAGFIGACTAEHRSLDAEDDPLALPRVQIRNWSPIRLRQELALASLPSRMAVAG